MMKFATLSIVVLAVAFTAAPVLSIADSGAPKQDTMVITDSVHAQATVTGIKKKQRELTLRGESGDEIVVIAGKEVRNFDQIKKGDIVEVDYQLAAASRLEKISDTNIAVDATVVERAPAGAKPGMDVMQTTSIVAKVLKIDPKSRLLTVQGPQGGIVTVQVPASIKAFDSLKKGDSISAVYTEAVAISVRTPAKK
jgi:hypothetical protein